MKHSTGRSVTVLLAPDKFKGTLSAAAGSGSAGGRSLTAGCAAPPR